MLLVRIVVLRSKRLGLWICIYGCTINVESERSQYCVPFYSPIFSGPSALVVVAKH